MFSQDLKNISMLRYAGAILLYGVALGYPYAFGFASFHFDRVPTDAATVHKIMIFSEDVMHHSTDILSPDKLDRARPTEYVPVFSIYKSRASLQSLLWPSASVLIDEEISVVVTRVQKVQVFFLGLQVFFDEE